MLDRHRPIADIVLDHSACASVFQRYRIDFCCRGATTLEQAARARAVDLDVLLAELEAVIAERASTGVDPRALATPQLVAYIVGRYHDALRRTLPLVEQLAKKVARVHGAHDPRLRELEEAVLSMGAILLVHLDEEERVVFPAVEGARDLPVAAGLLGAMMDDHLTVGALLERVRTITGNFTLPDWACTSYRTLFAELHQLEGDVFEHVHLENHVLAPRFLPA